MPDGNGYRAPVAAAPMEVDFEISDIETPAPHNLIEFDAPDLSVTPPPPDTRP